MDFAQRLKELRKSAGLTQEELAEKIGKKRSTIAGYETENKEPDLKTLKQLAELFDVSLEYLVGISQEKGSFKKHKEPFYIPEGYIQKYELTADELKGYLNFMKNQIGALFMNDRIGEEDKDALLRDISQMYWIAKELKKQKEAEKKGK